MDFLVWLIALAFNSAPHDRENREESKWMVKE